MSCMCSLLDFYKQTLEKFGPGELCVALTSVGSENSRNGKFLNFLFGLFFFWQLLLYLVCVKDL